MLVASDHGSQEGSGEKMVEAVYQALCLAQDMGGAKEYCHGVEVKLVHLLARDWGVGLDVACSMKQALSLAAIMNTGKLRL